MKTFYSFFKSQINQVRKGGVSVFYHKIKKISGLLGMELLAPLSVYFAIPWPEAYRFIGNKNLKKYIEMRLTSKGDLRKVQDVQRKIVVCLEKHVSFDPKLNKVSEWIDTNFRLNDILLCIPELENIDKASQVASRVEQFRQNISTKYKIPEPDIAFTPRELAVGSLGAYENLEKYLKAMVLGSVPDRKLFLLVDPQSTVNNPCYLNYWGEHVTVVTQVQQIKKLVPQEQYLTVPMRGLFKQYGKKWLPCLITLGAVREQWIRQKRSPLLNLSKADQQRGWDCLTSRGVPKGAWFVGLHVRGPGWRDKSSETHNVRNADIQTYFSAIKSVTDAGGWVIRLGDPISMAPLPAMDRVIDYAHSDLKSDWMDIFLSSQCRFFIGTGSGVYTVAIAFGVPCVMTNITPSYNMFAFTSQDIFLLKLCRLKEENRYLTFQELADPPVGVSFFAYKDMGIEVVENTPDEIKGAVDEMIARCDGTLKYSQEDEGLQVDFKSVVKHCAPLYGDKDIELYARIGRAYLRKHASLLPAKEGLILTTGRMKECNN